MTDWRKLRLNRGVAGNGAVHTRPQTLVVSVVLLMSALLLTAPYRVEAQTTFYEAYDRGLALVDAGRWNEARVAFEAAARLQPDPAKRIKTYGLNFLHDYDPYFHLARVELELGMLDDASAHIDRSAAAAVSPADQIAALREAIERAGISHRTPTPTPAPSPPEPTRLPAATVTEVPPPTLLDVTTEPPGAEVFVDGRRLGLTPVKLPVDPGRHRVELLLDGFEIYRREHRVAAGSTSVIRARLERSASGVSPTAPPPPPTATHVVAPVPAAEVAPTATPTEPPATATPSPRPEQKTAAVPEWIVASAVAGVIAIPIIILTVLFLRSRRPAQGSPSVHTLTPTRRMDTPSGLSGTTPLPEGTNPAFGGYTLREVLGRGGMATTYLAVRNRDGEPVALKIPHEHLLDDPEFVERFVREGALGATIHHPNIVRIWEAERVGSRPYIAMELLAGETLRDRLGRQTPIPLRSALEITRGIALALDYAHVKGIVHRDLKPDNVMIMPDGSVKVMDFGIARIADAPGLTASNAYIGTPLYSAPECLTPSSVDHRTDLYSLGIILYAMLSGSPPFQADSPLRLLELHRDARLPDLPDDLEVPPSVEAMVTRLTAKSKRDRYPSAEVLLAELNVILNSL